MGRRGEGSRRGGGRDASQGRGGQRGFEVQRRLEVGLVGEGARDGAPRATRRGRPDGIVGGVGRLLEHLPGRAAVRNAQARDADRSVQSARDDASDGSSDRGLVGCERAGDSPEGALRGSDDRVGHRLGRDGVDDVDAEDFGPRDAGRGEGELDVPATAADGPGGRVPGVGHREGQAVSRLGDGQGVLIELLVLEGRGDGRRQEVGRTRRTRRPSEDAGEGVTPRDGYGVGTAHRV